MATRATAPRKPRAIKVPATRTLLVEVAGGAYEHPGKFKITVPATCRITYGLLHPGTKTTDRYGRSEVVGQGESNVLRIYEGTTQTAVFRNVRSFRDLGYEYEYEVVTVEEESKADTKGSKASTRKVRATWEDEEN